MCLEDKVTDHSYAGCEVPCASVATTMRPATLTGSPRRCSRSRHGRSTIRPDADDPCQAVVERLRRQGASGSRSDSTVCGLDAELALPLGIELADGEVL